MHKLGDDVGVDGKEGEGVLHTVSVCICVPP